MKYYLVDNLTPDTMANIPDIATIFHHPAWQKTIEATYGCKSHYIVLEGQSPTQVGGYVLPVMQLGGNRWVSLPFTDYTIPLLQDISESADITNELNKLRKNLDAGIMEVRWPLPIREKAFSSEKFYWHTTALSPDSELVFKSFKRSQVQRNIRKAEKDGVTVHIGTTRDDVKLFYKLHLQTRRRLGTPIQPMRYFQNLWENLLNRGLGFIILAYHGEQLLAGAVFLHWKHTLTYKYGASDDRFWKLRPNHMIFWEAIRWGCENGYQVFDWGRTDLEDEGLRDFKLGWGSEERILQYTILADQAPRPAGQRVLRKLMKTVIQRSPLFVCRVLGELFYRFAA